MKPCQPGGRKQPPPVEVVYQPVFPAVSGFDWGFETLVYPDVAWTKKPAEPIPPRKEHTPPPVVVIATDGSVGHAPGRGFAGGWGWVSEHGKADAGAFKTADTNVAELKAIAAACAAPEYRRHKLHILSDSLVAIRVVNDIVAGQVPDGVSSALTMPIRERAADISIEWVKGHNGHLLNEIADRLALMARRRYQARLEGDVHELARTIAERELRVAS